MACIASFIIYRISSSIVASLLSILFPNTTNGTFISSLIARTYQAPFCSTQSYWSHWFHHEDDSVDSSQIHDQILLTNSWPPRYKFWIWCSPWRAIPNGGEWLVYAVPFCCLWGAAGVWPCLLCRVPIISNWRSFSRVDVEDCVVEPIDQKNLYPLFNNTV